MTNKKLVVCLKYYKGELNPFDACALESALTLGFKDITVLAMAPLSCESHLKSLTRLGVKAVLVSDVIYQGSDTLATSLVLSTAIKKLSPDVIFCGRQSVDGDTAFVPSMLGARLGFDIKDRVFAIEDDKLSLRNGEILEIKENTIYTFERFMTLRFFSIFSKVKDVTILDNNAFGIPKELCGLYGSKTRVIKTYESTVGRRFCKFIDSKDIINVIKEALKKSYKETLTTLNKKINSVLFVGDLQKLASNIAENYRALNVDNKKEQDIIDEINTYKPDAVLFEDTDKNKLLAPRIAVLMDAGICADCIDFDTKDNALILTRPALGGNVTADIVCTDKPAFATVRTAKKSNDSLILSVGKGAISELSEIKKVANSLNVEVCSSRVVTDSGAMPYKSQVGLTGKRVSAKVYIALGISGAVQHTSAITSVGTVIAVNTDKNARIFDYADYGVVSDVKTIIKELKNLSL